jgi:hypothetical protein
VPLGGGWEGRVRGGDPLGARLGIGLDALRDDQELRGAAGGCATTKEGVGRGGRVISEGGGSASGYRRGKGKQRGQASREEGEKVGVEVGRAAGERCTSCSRAWGRDNLGLWHSGPSVPDFEGPTGLCVYFWHAFKHLFLARVHGRALHPY